MKSTMITGKKQRKAFALVLALALMGFMVLLTVSLATMVSMQMRLSRQNVNAFKARQAAKFSAYKAMAQVQTALGPDQRITASAGMFTSSVFSGITALDTDSDFDWWSSPMDIRRTDAEDTSGTTDANRHWVGVWHSKRGYQPDKQTRTQSRSGYVDTVLDKAMTWLVSGNEVACEDKVLSGSTRSEVEYRPDSRLTDTNSVKLVTQNSYRRSDGVNDAFDDVMAPLVTLEADANDSEGIERDTGIQTRIAWWVADEGQKASLNAIAPYEFKREADTVKFRVQSLPFYSGVQGLTVGENGGKMYDITLDDDGADTSGMTIARGAYFLDMLDVAASQNVSPDTPPSKYLFHAATCDTKGLLVNVRDGGLKKDLSLGLIQTNGLDDEHARTTEAEIRTIPEYFPRPYGVSGFFTKTTAYPIRFVSGDSDWRMRREKKPYLTDKQFIGNRDFSGHIFGPQMFEREDIAVEGSADQQHPKQSFGRDGTVNDWNEIFCDTMLWKDPGGALWDQLRSYYNLRAPNESNNSEISARVQTDDRFGAKPVVKRFQVHYVPALVDYGQERYGLRLHIIPTLVLWNPYDTKIGEDAYYAIRVSARDFQEYHNPIGSFRFAIGYQTGSYFQCLRDLYTEKVQFRPRANGENNIDGNVNFMKKNGFHAYHMGMWSNTGSYGGSWDGGAYYHQYDPLSGDVGNIGRGNKAYANKMSSTIPFYSLSTRSRPWMPLGYGEVANSRMSLNSSLDKTRFPGFSASYEYTSTFWPTTVKDDQPQNWRSIVSEDNMVPSASDSTMSSWSFRKNTPSYSRGYNIGELGRYARIAKIPLFLNNLYVNLCHGSYASRLQSSHDIFFYAQRGIAATLVDSRSLDNLMTFDYHQTPDLIFLARDTSGINPGASKVFAMRKPINYLGNPTNNGTTNPDGTRNGPSGILEDDSKSVSPYETLNAMMLPIGEGGNLGGCFYIDVPHPELEHNAKYNNNRPIVTTGVIGQNQLDSQLPNPYILFDLNEIRRYPHTDPNGRTSSSLSISNILIDMEDTAVFPNCENNGSRITPYYMRVFDTPMAYCLSRSHTSYDTNESNAVDTYPEIMLSIWIYKKEGMTFSNISDYPTGDWHRRLNYGFPDYVPLLAFFKGRRNFLGSKYPSFPNPAMTYRWHGSNWEEDRYNNWHFAGFIRPSNGGGSSPRNMIALTPLACYSNDQQYLMYERLDQWLANNQNVREDMLEAIKESSLEKWNALSQDARDAFNGRFFLNWLPINPRRHSANFWPYNPAANTSGITRGLAGDFLPGSRALAPNLLLNSGQVSNDDYTSVLANVISDQQCRFIPYGYMFGLPYADDDNESQPGAKPIHNRRLFVNGTLLATYYNIDYNAQEVSDTKQDMRNRAWGMTVKSAIATSIVYYNKSYDGGNRAPGGGLSQMGYKIPGPSDSTAYVGLTQTSGTDTNPLHHILREEEVVHNIANLSAANLNFGTGKWDATSNWNGGDAPFASQKDANRPWPYSYGLFSPEALMAGMAIGNSLCPLRVCPEYTYQVLWLDGSSTANNYPNKHCKGYGQTYGTREEYEEKNVVYDLSWHLNDALWDEYFFSTLPYRNNDLGSNFSMGRGYATPLNPRIQYISTDREDRVLTVNQMKYSEEESDKQFDQNASKLWINGPFNVNSVSVDAWKAVLSTYYGQTIEGYERGTSDNTNSAPFHRWQAPLRANNKVTNSTNISQEEALFTGYRALSDEEIEELASSIVAHIKDRGPFYSMSDFVNRLAANYSAEEKYAYKKAREENLLSLDNQQRRISESDLRSYMRTGGETYRVGHAQKGVLQAAIDATSINSNFNNRYVIGKDVNDLNSSWQGDNIYRYFEDSKDVWENWRAAVGPIATGAPAYLMQQDILARLGSFLTVRSDTFKIRAYGEIRNPVSGVVEAKAWCEMVVQRTPEYMDNSEFGNAPEDVYGREKELGYQYGLEEYNTVMNDTNGGLTKINQALGRRFKIVSFRWLNENEI